MTKYLVECQNPEHDIVEFDRKDSALDYISEMNCPKMCLHIVDDDKGTAQTVKVIK